MADRPLGVLLARAAAWFSLGAACAPEAQERKPISIDFGVELKQRGRYWLFVFSGATNLPAGTLLDCTVYHPDKIQGQEEAIADNLFLKDDRIHFRVGEGGKIAALLYRMGRRPFSLSYVGRISYDPAEQEPEMLAKIRPILVNEKVERIFPFHVGDPKEFQAECDESARTVVQDFKELGDWADKLKAAYAARADEAAWNKLRDDETLGLRRLLDRNEDRFTLFTVFLERRMKFYIEDLVESLLSLAESFDAALATPGNKEREKELKDRIAVFDGLYNEAKDFVKPPPDLRKLGKAIQALARPVKTALAAGAEALEGRPKAWAGARAELGDSVDGPAFELCRLAANEKQIYPYVEEVRSAFADYGEAMDALIKEPSDKNKRLCQNRAAALQSALQALIDLR